MTEKTKFVWAVPRLDGIGADIFFKTKNVTEYYSVSSEAISTRRGLIRAIHKACSEPWIDRRHILALIELSHAFVNKNV